MTVVRATWTRCTMDQPARNRRSNRGTRPSCPMRAQRCDFDVATACCHLAALALFARRPLGSVGSHPVDQPSSQRVSCLWCAGDRIRTRSTWVDAPLCGAGLLLSTQRPRVGTNSMQSFLSAVTLRSCSGRLLWRTASVLRMGGRRRARAGGRERGGESAVEA